MHVPPSIYIYIYTCVRLCMYTCMYVYVYVYMYVYHHHHRPQTFWIKLGVWSQGPDPCRRVPLQQGTACLLDSLGADAQSILFPDRASGPLRRIAVTQGTAWVTQLSTQILDGPS